VSIGVLIADDQALVRAGFRMALEVEDDTTVVGEAANGEQAIHGARRLQPDVVLMDIRMPELDGIAATRQIRSGDPGRADPEPRVLILTTFTSTSTSMTRSPPARAGSSSRTARPSGSWAPSA
jgi:DNA-binding NarL/FixJ family response regulator